VGGEFGDEDERLITRLENSQYDAAAALDTEPFGADSPLQGAGPNSWQPAQDRPPHGKNFFFFLSLIRKKIQCMDRISFDIAEYVPVND